MDRNQKPIRVLQVFARMDRGGAEAMIMNLYRSIDRSKVQFDFVVHTNDKCAFDEEILSLGGVIHRVPKYNVVNHFKYKKSWEKLFTEYPEYKLIHAHVRSTASIFLQTAKKYGLKTIAHSHNTSSGSGVRAVVKTILQKRITRYSDLLFAASKKAGEWLFGKAAIIKDDFFILNNAINTENYVYDEIIRREKRKELGIANETVIGHVGRMHSQKNHLYLIDIYKEYVQINPNSKLLLLGDGGLRNEIQKKVAGNGLLDKVVFLGVRSDVEQLLQAVDIFVMPSLFEGLPVALIEAQAAGLPILAADTITEEVKITSLVNFKSIEIEPKLWAKDIDKLLVKTKKNMSKEIKKAGYDVKTTANWLEEFYLKEHYKHQKDN